jgi:hypothetical protein
MNIFATGRNLWVGTGLVVLVLMAGAPALAQHGAVSEVLLEGGVSEPRMDLADSWYSPTGKGFGAETGYEVGFRFRYFASPSVALSPSFHFVDFANFLDVDNDGYGFEVQTSILRYSMDLQLFMGTNHAKLRPFISVGAVLNNNRYQDYSDSDMTTYKTNVYALGGAAGGGFRAGIFEISVLYNYNRFSTVRLDPEGLKRTYNWDYLSVIAGFSFPTY